MTQFKGVELREKILSLQFSRRQFAAAAAGSSLAARGLSATAQDSDIDPIYTGEVFDAEGETLRVASWGGFWEEVEREVILNQMEKDFNCKVTYDSAFPWFPKIVAGGEDNPPFDVVNWNLMELFKTARTGDFFVPIDELMANVPSSQRLWDFAFENGLGITYLFGQYGYGYRTDTVDPAPTSFEDFWEDRFADKRGSYITSNSLQAVFFLMASDHFGEDEFDIDAGVEAMQNAMPMKISDFTGNMQALLERGEVNICVQVDGEVFGQMDRGIPVDWMYWTHKEPILTQTKTVSKGSNDVQKALAYAYIDRACSPEYQHQLAQELTLRPSNQDTELPENIAAKNIETGPEAMDRLWIPDWDWYLDNEMEIVERVNEIFGQ